MRQSLVEHTAKVFVNGGPLSQHIRNYECRPQQQIMAQAVAKCLSRGKHLLIEAGTGVGKTYSYLAPILLSGQRVIISTGTKNLQEQLVAKDLPALTQMLSLPRDVALLKGRGNYLCQWQLMEQLQASSSLDAQVLDDLLRIHQWQTSSLDGDLDSLQWVSEHSKARDLVRSRADGCQGQRCDYYQACFTRKARAKACEAKLVVVNHHLLLAEHKQVHSDVEPWLPNVDAIVLDEAHQLPDLLARHFARTFSMVKCQQLLNQLAYLGQTQLSDTRALTTCVHAAALSLAAWQQLLIEHYANGNSVNWRHYLASRAICTQMGQLQQQLVQLTELLTALLVNFPELDAYVIGLDELCLDLNAFIETDDSTSAYVVDGLSGAAYAAGLATSNNTAKISLHQIPWQLGHQFQQLLTEQYGADCRLIMTSATLQMHGSLQTFASTLGFTGKYANQVEQVVLDSPFDYGRQALLCVPRQLYDVRHQQSAAQLISICQQAISAADGRTFVLFTSHAMLNQVAARLPSLVSQPVLIQGQGSKSALLDKFRQLGNAVLLGSFSFWEGVDVKGRQLSCVIIDKLPFTPPDDPLLAMKSLQLQLQGQDPFTQLAVPLAAMKLKQGVGRLIRDSRDQGALILCDHRIVNRPYGGALLAALPPMRRTRDLQQALDFLQKI
ncbi:ATP-dependent DNA helicase [Shewanella sp. SNU WT4]|uniref:ATP-dependent DNA helicase n=1 Tax=Shewanella sp. SNU WT4 TaxID=2590015 RepID=UPI00112D1D43|nr:ATP-dependent DNA helicase [Shewanella sp. SNU WT4]QDF66886.1 ATP-dependent DNA helicase [Shewanella sp. SNU WT4]